LFFAEALSLWVSLVLAWQAAAVQSPESGGEAASPIFRDMVVDAPDALMALAE
jgi:hypothetical protein